MRRLLIAALLFAPTSVAAQTDDTVISLQTGNKLFENCEGMERLVGGHGTEGDGVKAQYCFGYVAGVSDALCYSHTINLPVKVTLAQLVAVVMLYFRNHPSEWHYSAAGIVRTALIGAFPK